MIRLLADVGNSRLKWGRVVPSADDSSGSSWEEVALPVGDEAAWPAVWDTWNLSKAGPMEWGVSSVNPAVAADLERFLRERGVDRLRVFRSALDVPVLHELETPQTAGADRALGVLGALSLPMISGTSVVVVSCGSAITVDRVLADGLWTGGAIAPGLALASDTLHRKTAQLPFVQVEHAPPAWGRSTTPAIEAGVFWGCVGTVRELVSRQSAGLGPDFQVVWTGGDSVVLAEATALPRSQVVSSLVFRGLLAALEW